MKGSSKQAINSRLKTGFLKCYYYLHMLCDFGAGKRKKKKETPPTHTHTATRAGGNASRRPGLTVTAHRLIALASHPG
jgi:hypothetical protein